MKLKTAGNLSEKKIQIDSTYLKAEDEKGFIRIINKSPQCFRRM